MLAELPYVEIQARAADYFVPSRERFLSILGLLNHVSSPNAFGIDRFELSTRDRGALHMVVPGTHAQLGFARARSQAPRCLVVEASFSKVRLGVSAGGAWIATTRPLKVFQLHQGVSFCSLSMRPPQVVLQSG